MTELITDGAYGTGLATVTADGTVLDVWYPAPALFSSAAPNTEQPELRLAERTDDIRATRSTAVDQSGRHLRRPAEQRLDLARPGTGG